MTYTFIITERALYLRTGVQIYVDANSLAEAKLKVYQRDSYYLEGGDIEYDTESETVVHEINEDITEYPEDYKEGGKDISDYSTDELMQELIKRERDKLVTETEKRNTRRKKTV